MNKNYSFLDLDYHNEDIKEEENKIKNSFNEFDNKMKLDNFTELKHNYYTIGKFYYNYKTKEMIFFDSYTKRKPSEEEYLHVLSYNNIKIN